MTLRYREYRAFGENEIKYLIIFLHGYGSNKDDLITLAPEIQISNACFISLDAPFGFEGDVGFMDQEVIEDVGVGLQSGSYSPSRQWFSLISREYEAMESGAAKAHSILSEFIRMKLSELSLTYNKLVLIGFSQGAMLAMYYTLASKNPPGAILCYSGMILEPKNKGMAIPSTTIMLIHGRYDEIIDHKMMEISSAKLTDLGYTVYRHSCDNLGHGINENGIFIGSQFLKKYCS